MTPRALLVRGLVAGLLAGLATFFVASTVGEPPLETAISLEEPNSHHEEPVVARGQQRTWGLLAGTVTVGVALGGLVALVAAGTLGRWGGLSPSQSTALVALIGFVACALVPFLKYPATPPAVGSSETIGDRTALYFGFVLVSLTAAVLASYAALRVREHRGTYLGVVVGAGLYLAAVVLAGHLFVTVNEVGDFPADTLWFFRRASLLVLATTWGVLGVVLAGLVGRLHAEQVRVQERRRLAASL